MPPSSWKCTKTKEFPTTRRKMASFFHLPKSTSASSEPNGSHRPAGPTFTAPVPHHRSPSMPEFDKLRAPSTQRDIAVQSFFHPPDPKPPTPRPKPPAPTPDPWDIKIGRAHG